MSDDVASVTWEVQEGIDNYEIWISQVGYGQVDNPTIDGNQTSASVTAAYGDWHRVWIHGINEDGTGP